MITYKMRQTRKAAVAGQFYPSSLKELTELIGSFIDKKVEKSDVIGCVLPHAGYVYSGRVATETVSHIRVKNKVILLGPNHTGYGTEFSIMCEGAWQTPLGDVAIDQELARKILKQSKFLKEDSLAHLYEHSLEVEIPILQYFRKDFQIVPISVVSGDIEALKSVGKEIATVIKDSKAESSTLLVASSDMTHYEPQKSAEEKDHQAIEAILALSEDKLMERIKRLDISMCGYAPVVIMLSAAKALGAKGAKLIKYQTSGEVSQDYSSVVGYAGITVA